VNFNVLPDTTVAVLGESQTMTGNCTAACTPTPVIALTVCGSADPHARFMVNRNTLETHAAQRQAFFICTSQK
jgi:hypothetical protein